MSSCIEQFDSDVEKIVLSRTPEIFVHALNIANCNKCNYLENKEFYDNTLKEYIHVNIQLHRMERNSKRMGNEKWSYEDKIRLRSRKVELKRMLDSIHICEDCEKVFNPKGKGKYK